MEITIDKSKSILIDRYIDTYVVCGGANYNPTINITREDYEAFQVAINTMRKYQQIVQIYQKWNEVNDFSYNQAMQMIGEVIENRSSELDKNSQKLEKNFCELIIKEIHGVREEFKAIEKELHNLNRIQEKRKI